ncbi:uncharacterized protein [Lolium perenne]|uniref:uncharacterized protein isoform X2 n=1 Tax=Lolium perenne TaxID=4522 RepID=UPI0021F585A1|nr:uncharacterized protein LOC127302663 isoform X2 [Lolium perenne]XP_051189154.1 uncharacterized protein LOC127302663 isoform X2 [Lolium perenne]XP_051189155.1 uncharacterized protein LOC127302663 isoform X2 [Lolium perenne]XP_051189156.1 uncharacterized protein LOC127302663 isoform X2 [Lolium perenne]XP_051189157.1 uncharacterized protein LOC127302663 isoform X2 [Lolium perenne]
MKSPTNQSKQIGRTAEAAKLVGSKKKDFFLGFYFGHISQSYRAWRNSPRCAKTTFVSVYFSNLIRKVVFSRKFKGVCKFSNNFMVSISSHSIILHQVPVGHVGVGGALLKTNTAELGAAGPREIHCVEPRPPASPSICPVAKSRQPHPEAQELLPDQYLYALDIVY